jgi:hypothetical protein
MGRPGGSPPPDQKIWESLISPSERTQNWWISTDNPAKAEDNYPGKGVVFFLII